MKLVINFVWILVLLVFGFGIGAFYIIGSKNSAYYSFDYYLEEFILAGISFVVTMVIVGLITFIITKLIKSKNKLKVALYTVSVVVLIFGVQAYFLADKVILIKQKAIIWENNEPGLIYGVNKDLQNQGYDQTIYSSCAECIIDQIKYDDDFLEKSPNKMICYLF